MIWFIFGLMTLVAVAALLYGMRRAERSAARGRGAYENEIYRAQLREIARDHREGLLDDEGLAAAKAEIARKLFILADEEPDGDTATRRLSRRSDSLTAAGLILALPALAVATYLALGRPDLPGLPYKAGLEQAEDRRAELETIRIELEKRLAESPKEIESLILLGRVLAMLDRPGEAIEALARAYSLAPEDAAVAMIYGEMLVQRSGGRVTARARAFFSRLAEDVPDHPGAGFFLGLADAQEGDSAAAAQRWAGLLQTLPEDSPWQTFIRRHLRDLASSLGLDPEAMRSTAPGATKTREDAGSDQ